MLISLGHDMIPATAAAMVVISIYNAQHIWDAIASSSHNVDLPSDVALYEQTLHTAYIDVSGNPQPEAIGHTRTCLQENPGAGTMHGLQPCQLGNDSLLNMVIHPLWTCMEGPPFVHHSEFQEDLG